MVMNFVQDAWIIYGTDIQSQLPDGKNKVMLLKIKKEKELAFSFVVFF